MKKILATLVIVFMAASTFAINSNVRLSKSSEANSPTPEQKHKMAVEFLESYDENFSIMNWNVRVKKNKVIMRKYGSLQRIALFNQYFINVHNKKLKEETTNQ